MHAIKKISSLSSFDSDKAVELAQSRTWEALNISPEFNVSFKKTYQVLEQYLGSKVNLVVLHIDLVGSTKLSMDLPPDKLMQ